MNSLTFSSLRQQTELRLLLDCRRQQTEGLVGVFSMAPPRTDPWRLLPANFVSRFASLYAWYSYIFIYQRDVSRWSTLCGRHSSHSKEANAFPQSQKIRHCWTDWVFHSDSCKARSSSTNSLRSIWFNRRSHRLKEGNGGACWPPSSSSSCPRSFFMFMIWDEYMSRLKDVFFRNGKSIFTSRVSPEHPPRIISMKHMPRSEFGHNLRPWLEVLTRRFKCVNMNSLDWREVVESSLRSRFDWDCTVDRNNDSAHYKWYLSTIKENGKCSWHW